MTVTRSNIVACARSYVGTPFVHQGRVKGVGIDCIGLIVMVARDCGLRAEDGTGYTRHAKGRSLAQEIDKQMIRVQHDVGFGDVALFWIRKPKLPQHLGILTDSGIIHTSGEAGIKKVVEHVLDDRWKKRIVQYYRFPGVED